MSEDDGQSTATDGARWPVDLRGVTETVVTTRGPNGRWNVAALGVHGRDTDLWERHADKGVSSHSTADRRALAETYGRTRTWRNFRERGGGVVQFTRDSLDFAEAALSVREEDESVLASADAWARVRVEAVDDQTEGGTRVVTWELTPVEAGVEREAVPRTSRGYYAVVEATVAASRLDVPSYDTETLLDRLAYFATVVEACGSDRDREAMARVRELVDTDF
jgi:hypothetical protein